MNAIIIFGAKYLIYVTLVFAVFFFFRLSRADKVRLIKVAVVALPLAYILALIAGHFYYDARPFVVGNFAPLIAHAADNGFPSDHALLLSAVAAVFFFFSRKGSAVLWVCTILVAVARVMAGVHHSIDMIGSVVIAIAAAWIAWTISSRSLRITSSQP